MITKIIISILFVVMIGTIISHYIKKLMFIAKSIKYMKLQKLLAEIEMKKKAKKDHAYNKTNSNKNDPMFN